MFGNKDYDQRWAKVNAWIAQHGSMAWLVMYLLDAMELLGHGTGIRGSWLEDSGEQVLAFLKAHGTDPDEWPERPELLPTKPRDILRWLGIQGYELCNLINEVAAADPSIWKSKQEKDDTISRLSHAKQLIDRAAKDFQLARPELIYAKLPKEGQPVDPVRQMQIEELKKANQELKKAEDEQ